MGDPMDTLPSPEPLDLDAIRSGVRELSEALKRSSEDLRLCGSNTEQFPEDCVLHLMTKIEHVASEYSDVGSLAVEEYDAYLERLKGELEEERAGRASVSNEIEVLTRTLESSNQLESDVEVLKLTLDSMKIQGMEEAKGGACGNCPTHKDNHVNAMNLHDFQKFEVLKLLHQFEKNQILLESLQDLEHIFNTFEAIDEFGHALTGLEVMEFKGNCIRLSLSTHITNLEGLLHEQKIDSVIEPSEVNHEMLIEMMNGTMELKKVEIFPNDVYIGEIIDATRSFRTIFAHSSSPGLRSSLVWFVQKVQDRITLCTLRRSVVKAANNLRHSFEYVDRDEMIVAHMAQGVDAIIKMAQGWPITNSTLRLTSLKSSDYQAKGVSLSLFSKVEEAANSLDLHVRRNISSFVDAIEEILIQQMRVEIHSDDMHAK